MNGQISKKWNLKFPFIQLSVTYLLSSYKQNLVSRRFKIDIQWADEFTNFQQCIFKSKHIRWSVIEWFLVFL